MNKAEFLELRAGEQRWVLLRCLIFAVRLIYRLGTESYDAEVEQAMAMTVLNTADRAAQESTEDES